MALEVFMKKLLAILFATSLCGSVFATDIFAFTALRGSVKSFTQTDYSVASKFGSYYKTPAGKVLKKYNAEGKEIESVQLTPRDVVTDKIITSYDAYSNITEQKCVDADGNLIWKNVNTYKNNRRDNCAEYDAKGELKAKTIYTYVDGLLADETGYSGEGVLVWKILYSYDEIGRPVKIIQYNADGALDSQEDYTYNADGAIETVTMYDSFAEKTTQQVFRYTDNVLTEITTYDANKVVIKRMIFKNDAKGNPVKVSDYNIAEKFGTTVNELLSISEVVYNY